MSQLSTYSVIQKQNYIYNHKSLQALNVLAVLAVGLSSTSTGVEAEAPTATVVSGPVAAPTRSSLTTIGVDPELAAI
jgi:hypothetical protein